MKRKIPTFKTDEDAEIFVSNEDLSHFDLSGGELVKFEFKLKDKSISLRLSDDLLAAVQERAAHEGIPYQRFIRQAIEHEVARSRTD